jgi:hypothetical protein
MIDEEKNKKLMERGKRGRNLTTEQGPEIHTVGERDTNVPHLRQQKRSLS